MADLLNSIDKPHSSKLKIYQEAYKRRSWIQNIQILDLMSRLKLYLDSQNDKMPVEVTNGIAKGF